MRYEMSITFDYIIIVEGQICITKKNPEKK